MSTEREATARDTPGSPVTAAGDRERELEELFDQLLQSQEQDRLKLARELHDQFGSLLISAKMDIESVAGRLGEAQPELAARLRRAQMALEQVVEIKRRMVEELRPSLLDNLGLGAALEWLVSEVCGPAGLPHTLSVSGDMPASGPIPITMFRVVETTLSGLVRSAHAKCVSIELTGDESNVSLIIEHDGGELRAASGHGGLTLGFAGMRQRVKALRGELSVRRAPDGKTVVEVNLPQRPFPSPA